MARSQSKNFRLQLTESSPPAWETVAFGQSDSFALSNSEVDATTKDSGGWSEVFPAGSIKTATIEASWVFADEETHQRVADVALSADPVITARVIDQDSGRYYAGEWLVTSYTLEGASAEGFVVANVSMRNVGPIDSGVESPSSSS
jgi:predicted secreted protein